MERPGNQYINQSTSTDAGGTEEMTTSVDTSGFGMYSSGTGTGAITGGGLLPDQYATSATAIQTQLPATNISCEDDGLGKKIKEKVVPGCMIISTNGSEEKGETHHEKKGFMEGIKEKLPGHGHHQ